MDLISVSERSPGGENGNPLQYSCLENLMDRGAWRATVHGVAKSWTQLSEQPRDPIGAENSPQHPCVSVLFGGLPHLEHTVGVHTVLK